MKNSIKTFAFALFLFVCANALQAQQKIAYIYSDSLIVLMPEKQMADSTIEQFRKKYEDALARKEDDYNKKYKEYQEAITKNKGVDIVFEHVGKETWMHSLHMLARGGRIVTCGATTGKDVNINLAHLFTKQHSILGSTMSSVGTFKEMMEKINRRIYFPFVDKIFNIQDIHHAHKYIENRQHEGKVLMKFD